MDKLSVQEQMCFSTTRIRTWDDKGNAYSGSGFFFNFKIGDDILPLLITNKHVVNGMVKGCFLMSEQDEQGNPLYKKHFNINFESNFKDNWIFHPNSNVDLCALPILPLVEAAKRLGGHRLFYRTFDNSLIPNQEIAETFDVAEDVLMIGYPDGLWDSVNNMPIVRRGTTATQYKLDYNGKKEFIVDAACFPGSSGSPILMCNIGSFRNKYGGTEFGKSRFYLLGILYAGPQHSINGDIKVVTIPTASQAIISRSTIPNNLGFIIKSERILEFAEPIKKIIEKRK